MALVLLFCICKDKDVKKKKAEETEKWILSLFLLLNDDFELYLNVRIITRNANFIISYAEKKNKLSF